MAQQYFSIERIKQAIDHLSKFHSSWIIVPLVFAVNGVNETDEVNPNSDGRAGTSRFLDRHFSGSLIGLQSVGGGDSLRPRFQDVSTISTDDYLSHQRVNLWGSQYSSRGYREMEARGLIERPTISTYRLLPTFWSAWDAQLPKDFHFEDLLVWLYAFSGFPDHITSWDQLREHFEETNLGAGKHFDPKYMEHFSTDNGAPWPSDNTRERPSNSDFQEQLIPSAGSAPAQDTPAPDEERPLNLILYGPPGTGKTYTTKRMALDIIHNDSGYSASKSDMDVAKEFQELRTANRVDFITFHQSYGYEEFIEGIRPILDTDKLTYEMRDGVFKKIANLAAAEYVKPAANAHDIGDAQFFKMSLGNTSDPESSNIYDYCVENGVIALGYGGDVDFSAVMKRSGNWRDDWAAVKKQFVEKLPDETSFGAQALYTFGIWMKIGDIVLVSKGNRTIRAIGQVTGEYEYRPTDELKYSQFRKVEWLLTDLGLPAEKLSRRNLSQQSIYNLKPTNLDLDAVQRLLSPGGSDEPAQNYVLVIDEINRGNVSKVFGELITLIEEDKRLKKAHEVKVTLPYSGDEFGVPSNLYLIGTMNTADRSIALIDIALRRRFRFKVLDPRPDLVPEEYRAFFSGLNESIRNETGVEYQVGHSYFMGVDSDERLANVMNGEIIPLLYEYFQDHAEDVRKVLLQAGAIALDKQGRVTFGGLNAE